MSKETKIAAFNEDGTALPEDEFVETAGTDDDELLLQALLDTPEEQQQSVFIKRFGQSFVVRSVTSDEYSRMEKRCKYMVKNSRTHQLEEKTNQDKLSDLLIATACVKPDWNNPKILAKYNTSDPATAIRKRLLIGEISELTQAIMDVSGFNDGTEEIKN